MHHAAVENLKGHVLSDGINQLAPVTHDGKGLLRVISTVHGEIHVHSVQCVAGIALHIGLKDRLTVLVHQATQLGAHLNSSHHAVGDIAAFLHLCDHATLPHDVFENVAGGCHDCTCGSS